MFSALKLQYKNWRNYRYQVSRKRQRKMLKRNAQRAARQAARQLRKSNVKPDGNAYVKQFFSRKVRAYWHVPVGASSFDHSMQVTRLYDNGTVLLRDIPGGPRRLRSTELRYVTRSMRGIAQNT